MKLPRLFSRLPGGSLLCLLFSLSCANRDAQQPQQPAGYPPQQGYAGTYGQPGPYGQPPPTYGQPPPPTQPAAQQPPQTPAQPTAPQPPPSQSPPSQPAPPPPAPSQQPPSQPPPAASAPLPLPPIGSFDWYGAFTSQYMRQEAPSVVAELVSALPDSARAKVQSIALQVVEDSKDVNAFAGCSKSGTPFMGITGPLLLIMARTSEARAFDETFNTAKYNELAAGIAAEVRARKGVAGPPGGFLPLPQALDPRKLARQKFLFDEQIAFVLGHELSHHHRGHTGCAGPSSNTITAQDIGRMLASTVPLFNQPNEIDADIQGTFNLLDTGVRRQGGRWTEEGAIMTLEFFSRLERLGVETLILGFMMTHPPPQVRLPIVQNAAAQWRGAGGKSPAFPLHAPS
ncbi:MAG TPA: M48 family metalloprotease [Polyangiaceae bacterium]